MRSLVESYLKRINAYDKVGPSLNAVQTINPHAVAEADRLDSTFKSSGPVGPLHCIPVLMEDSIKRARLPTTYGSLVFKDFVPQRNATIVTKLKQAGALIIGKTNMGEFAFHYVVLPSASSETPTIRSLRLPAPGRYGAGIWRKLCDRRN